MKFLKEAILTKGLKLMPGYRSHTAVL